MQRCPTFVMTSGEVKMMPLDNEAIILALNLPSAYAIVSKTRDSMTGNRANEHNAVDLQWAATSPGV